MSPYLHFFGTIGGLRVRMGSEKWLKLIGIRLLGTFSTFPLQKDKKWMQFLVVHFFINNPIFGGSPWLLK